jgi:hypothetical protein
MAFPLLGTPRPQFLNDSGSPIVNGTVSVLEPDDDTNKASYPTAADADAGTNANSNPMTLNSFGITPTGLFGIDGESYKIIVKDADDSTIWNHTAIKIPGKAEPFYETTSAETTAGATPINKQNPTGHIARYNPTGDGLADDTTAMQALSLAAIDGQELHLEENKTYLVNGAITFSADRLRLYGHGSTIIYSSASSQDQVVLVSGDDGEFNDFVVDANKSTLPGTNGDSHTGSGYGIKITGDRNLFRRCGANNTPVTTTETSSAGFEILGIDNVFEQCSADNVEYNGFRTRLNQNAQVDGEPVGSCTFRDCSVTGRRGWTNNSNARIITFDNFYWDPDGHSSPSGAFNCEITTSATVAEFNLLNTAIAVDAGAQMGKTVSAQVVNYRNCRLINLSDEDTSTDCIRAQHDSNSSSTPKLIVIDGCYLQAQAQGTGSVRAVIALETDSCDHCIIRNSILNLPDGDYIIHLGTEFVGRVDLESNSYLGAPALGIVRASSASGDFPRVSIRGGMIDVSTSISIFDTSGTNPDVGDFSVIDVHDAGETITGLDDTTSKSNLVAIGGPGILGLRIFGNFNPATNSGTGWLQGDIRLNLDADAGERLGVVATASGDDGSAGFNGFSQVGNRTNAGSPSGSLTPFFIGERAFDTSNEDWYTATGTGDTDWKQDSA